MRTLKSCRRAIALVSFLSILCAMQLAVAAPAPEEAVKAAISKMREASNLAPLCQYVDWESNYKKIDPAERSAMGFSGPGGMKSYFTALAESNGEHHVERLKKELSKAASGERPALQQQLSLVEQELERLRADLSSKLRKTNYEIGSVQVDGQTATVVVKKTYEEKAEAVELRLNNVGGSWLMESAAPLNPLSSVGMAWSPIGAVPQPIFVLQTQ